MIPTQDQKLLLGFIGASIITYNAILQLSSYIKSKQKKFIPIGTVKALYVYPIKSCKAKSVFSIYCHPRGAKAGESFDRHFLVIDGKTGKFYTARTKPQLVLLDCEVVDDVLHLKTESGETLDVSLAEVRERNNVRQTKLHGNLRTDGLDCGDEAADLLAKVIGEEDVRLVMYLDGMFTERTCIPQPSWWENNPVPNRVDNVAYADLAPYMITTQASLDALNTMLDTKVDSLNFRPVIVVDHCDAWDEDKWLDLQIGETRLQCFKPCTRCIMTTVDPSTGQLSKSMQPLKKLREFRLAPDGPMRKEFKDSPIFGVNAGVDVEGYIHVGQTVYATYKEAGRY